MLLQQLLSVAVFALAATARPHQKKRKTCSGSSGNSTTTITTAPSTSTFVTTTTEATATTTPTGSGGGGSGACFPNGGASFSDAGDVSKQFTVDNWWCKADDMYGFLGFSYPLESDDCSDSSNGFDQINSDFKAMKKYGATMVRVYSPECRDQSVWENLFKAGKENDMGVIPQVWWGFSSNQDLWKKTRDDILAVLDAEPLAAYVFHSVAFGSEPIGDGVLGGGDDFVSAMKDFKDQLSKYGVLIAMSEDWDRQGTLTNSDNSLTDLGKSIAGISDLLQVHPMPYYHCDKYPTADNVMDYFTWYVETLLEPNMPDLPKMITETQWSSSTDTYHQRGCGEPGEDLDNFKKFWNTYKDNCAYWKKHKVGWFVHTWNDEFEQGFGMLDSNNSPKMDFAPAKC